MDDIDYNLVTCRDYKHCEIKNATCFDYCKKHYKYCSTVLTLNKNISKCFTSIKEKHKQINNLISSDKQVLNQVEQYADVNVYLFVVCVIEFIIILLLGLK